MKNIHVLPIDKPSNLLLCIKDYIEHKNTPAENFDKKGNFRLGFGKYTNTEFYQFKNIYITSDEEIKEGDWVLLNDRRIVKAQSVKKDSLWFNDGLETMPKYCKKIILTTDQELIKDGVQAIDDKFLEWFIKNPSCEEVEVEKQERYMFEHYCDDGVNVGYSDNATQFHSYKETSIKNWDKLEKEFIYKIIIPKEEPKQDIETCENLESSIKDIEFEKGDKVQVNSTGVSQKTQQALVGEGVVMGLIPQGTVCHIAVKINGETLPFDKSELIKVETLEEAAEKYASEKLQRSITIYTPLESNVAEYVGFIDGAKWQAEQDNKKLERNIVITNNSKQETPEQTAERLLMEHPDFEVEGMSEYQNGKFNGIIEGINYQAERMHSEEDMLNFAWYFFKNIGQYSNDRVAHFEGKYLEQFKKKS